ncbi:hypothetical protein VTJ04DRAFT_1140 [Mycothermus thermophilus]|uniref:uncharacterized protein n=1 Tax=Humicola insolens TaxID=85995 RepID=UPI003742681E
MEKHGVPHLKPGPVQRWKSGGFRDGMHSGGVCREGFRARVDLFSSLSLYSTMNLGTMAGGGGCILLLLYGWFSQVMKKPRDLKAVFALH